ncbi:MAG: hypothetical protein AAF288_00225 [Planctomycetota bacterium]
MHHPRDTARVLHDCWEALSRYRWRFVLPAFLVCGAVLVMGWFLPRKYKAEAFFERRNDMVLSEMTSRQRVADALGDPRTAVNAEILSKPAVDEVLRELEPQLRAMGAVTQPEDLRALHRAVLNRGQVVWEIRSEELDRVRLEFYGPEPKVCQLIVNGLVDRYIQTTRDMMERKLRESGEFFAAESALKRAELDRLESEVLNFEIEHGEYLPEHPNGVPIKLAQAQVDLETNQMDFEAAQQKVDALESALASEPERIAVEVNGQNPDLVMQQGELRTARQRLNELKSELKMRDAHPDVVATRQEIDRLEREIALLPATVVVSRSDQTNPKRDELEVQLATAVAQRDALASQVKARRLTAAQLDAQATQMFPVRSEYRKLSRGIEEAQRDIQFWDNNLQRVELALAAETGNRGVQLKFLKRADDNPAPVSPRATQVIFLAVAMGLGAGALGVFLAYRSDDSIADGESLAKTFQVPVVGAVGRLVTEQQARMQRVRDLVIYPANGVAMCGVVIALATLLYLNLERPQTLGRIRAAVWGQSDSGGLSATPTPAQQLAPTATVAPRSAPAWPGSAQHIDLGEAPAARGFDATPPTMDHANPAGSAAGIGAVSAWVPRETAEAERLTDAARR